MNLTKKLLIWAIFLVLIAVFFIVLFFGGIFVREDNNLFPNDSEKIRVMATFFPLYDFTKNIGGDRIRVDILFPQTPEVASFKPTDVRKAREADIIVKNGAGLEPILDKLISTAGKKDLVVVDTSAGIEILSPIEGYVLSNDGDGESGKENLLTGDPHIWLDPQNAIIQTLNIRDAFIAYDPNNSDFYRQNAARYVVKMQNLDEEIKTEIDKLAKKDFISFHPAFQYFARRYGLNQVAVFEEFPGQEPSPKKIAEIINIIKEKQVRALFAEPQFSPKIMEAIAKDLGLEVRVLNPIETGDLEKDSYIGIMKNNLKTLQKAL